MDKKILLQDLANGVAARCNLGKKDSDGFVRNFFEVIEQYLQEEKLVKIKGLGTFKVVEVSGRDSVNIHTGERIHIQGHSKITYTPDSAIRDIVNRPFADFETVVLNDGVETADMEKIDEAAVPEIPEDVEDVLTDTASALAEQESADAPVVEPSTEPAEEVEETPVVEISTVEVPTTQEAVEEENLTVEESAEVIVSEKEVQSLETTTETEGTPVEPVEQTPVESVSETSVETVEESPSESVDTIPSENLELASVESTITASEESTEKEVASTPNEPMVAALADVPTAKEGVEEEENESNEILTENEDTMQNNKNKKSALEFAFKLILVLLLMFLSYMLGCHHVFDNCDKKSDEPTKTEDVLSAQEEQTAPAQGATDVPATETATETSSASTAQPSAAQQATPAQETTPSAVQTPAGSDPAANYPQVKYGAYDIVGVKTTVTLKKGESLRTVARRYLGGYSMVCYLTKLNNIENADLVGEGQEIQIPILQEKKKQ